MKLERSDRGPLVAFMLPAIVMMLVFFVIPVLYVVVVSFLKWNGISAPTFRAFKNFALLFKDKAFSRSVLNNVIWALVAGFIQVPLAMVMAIILSRKPKGWKFFRTVYFFPQVISGIALATLWRAIYSADTGLLNGLLRAVGLGHVARDWLGHHNPADQEDLAADLRDARERHGPAAVRAGLHAHQRRPRQHHVHHRAVHVQEDAGRKLRYGGRLRGDFDHRGRDLHRLYPQAL